MRANSITKYNVVIADDVQFEINIVKHIIEVAGLSNYLNIHECLYVEQGNGEETLNVIVNKLNRVDIAIIDWLWEQEFIGQKLEAGGERATDIVRSKFPDCKIIFATKFPLDAEDDRILHKYDAIHLKKETSDAALNQGKTRLENTIKECIKKRLFEITSSESSKKQCFKSIQNNHIQWNENITINNENWTFENLFFLYKNQPKERIDELFKKYLVRLPKVNGRKDADRWNQESGLYKSPLKDYYSLLLLDYYKEVDADNNGIKSMAESFLDELLNFLLTYLKDNNNTDLRNLRNHLFKKAETICDLNADVRKISDNKYSAFLDFKKKLIARLISITSYILFKMSAVSILYLFTECDFLSSNNVKRISHYLFIYKMCYDEQPSDFECLIHPFTKNRYVEKLQFYEPSDREYDKILGTIETTGSCADYELDFISYYFTKIKERIQQEKNEDINQYFEENFKVLNETNILNLRNNS
jgi:hypothetical protein